MLKTEVAQLKAELEELISEGYSVDVTDAEGFAMVVFHQYPLPPGYNKSKTELLLKMPLSYPNGRPDMFWTDEDLLLANGSVPRSADSIETPLGKRWRRAAHFRQARRKAGLRKILSSICNSAAPEEVLDVIFTAATSRRNPQLPRRRRP